MATVIRIGPADHGRPMSFDEFLAGDQGMKWKVIEMACGETYTTKLLPGFELILDPRQ